VCESLYGCCPADVKTGHEGNGDAKGRKKTSFGQMQPMHLTWGRGWSTPGRRTEIRGGKAAQCPKPQQLGKGNIKGGIMGDLIPEKKRGT